MPGKSYVANGRVRSWFFPFFFFHHRLHRLNKLFFLAYGDGNADSPQITRINNFIFLICENLRNLRCILGNADSRGFTRINNFIFPSAEICVICGERKISAKICVICGEKNIRVSKIQGSPSPRIITSTSGLR